MDHRYEPRTKLPEVAWSTFAGDLPRDLGLIDLSPTEMMFWMYCPVKLPDEMFFHLPDNLAQFSPVLNRVSKDMGMIPWINSYVYLTAKTLWVAGNYIGNRPGWHTDGFGTEDVNYIWSDRAPTEFVHGAFRLSTDCERSMEQMEQIGAQAAALGAVQTFPDKHLLRLDPRVIHRSPASFEEGMRTFVKVSVSEHRYDLVGNSINHEYGPLGPMVERQTTRNHPASKTV